MDYKPFKERRKLGDYHESVVISSSQMYMCCLIVNQTETKPLTCSGLNVWCLVDLCLCLRRSLRALIDLFMSCYVCPKIEWYVYFRVPAVTTFSHALLEF